MNAASKRMSFTVIIVAGGRRSTGGETQGTSRYRGNSVEDKLAMLTAAIIPRHPLHPYKLAPTSHV